MTTLGPLAPIDAHPPSADAAAMLPVAPKAPEDFKNDLRFVFMSFS